MSTVVRTRGEGDEGLTVTLRPVRPEDGPQFEALFHDLSPESIYRRFLRPVQRADKVHIDRLVNVDHCCEEATVAVLGEGPTARIVGVARICRTAPDEAELGVIVGDPWQRRGLGRVLMVHAMRTAEAMGIERFVSAVDPANTSILRLAASVAPWMKSRYEDGLVWVTIPTQVRGDAPG